MPRPGRGSSAGSGGPRPGPRPGNNPFASKQGMPRPGGGSQQRDHRGGRGRGRGGASQTRDRAPQRKGPRPSPMMMPDHSPIEKAEPAQDRRSRGSRRSGGGGRSEGGFQQRPAFSGPPRGGRGGRGATQGAFGRGGGKRKGRKSKRAKRHRHRMHPLSAAFRFRAVTARSFVFASASLADLADKIDVNPASLVTVLMHLAGTATQSLDEDTLKLGEELGYKVEVVSPEDEDREL